MRILLNHNDKLCLNFLQAIGGQVEMGKALVRCFAECGIPPHVANHASFRELIKTAQAFPGVKVPDYHPLLRIKDRLVATLLQYLLMLSQTGKG